VTLTTPLSGTVSYPRANTYHSGIAYNRAKFDVSSFSHSGDIYKDVQNLKVGHVTLTTPLSGTASYRQAVTGYDKPTLPPNLKCL